MTLNRLDSHNYALERIQNCIDEYVFQSYAQFQHRLFLNYFSCWEEEEGPPKKSEKQEKQQITQVKTAKKKTSRIADILNNRKKTQIHQSSQFKNDIANKSKKQIEQKKDQHAKIKVVYVQLEPFDQVSAPESVDSIKIYMSFVYLLAQAVNNSCGIWPKMIPVLTNNRTWKFVKKGKSRNEQLLYLFKNWMSNKQISYWSEQMNSIYQTYVLNGNMSILAQKIHQDLISISKKEYQLYIVVNGKKVQTLAQITSPQTLLIREKEEQINLAEYKIVFSYISQSIREVTLQHYIYDPIVLIGQSSNFVIRYLKTFIVN